MREMFVVGCFVEIDPGPTIPIEARTIKFRASEHSGNGLPKDIPNQGSPTSSRQTRLKRAAQRLLYPNWQSSKGRGAMGGVTTKDIRSRSAKFIER